MPSPMVCHGNACSDMSTGGVGNAMQFQNNGSKTIKISIQTYPNGDADYTLAAGGSINIGGAIKDDYQANYI